jgi:hypothetical protein
MLTQIKILTKPSKSQAAVEYLFTYGWAFMVILVMIGVFAYLGFTNPTKYVPDKCIASDGFFCRSGLFAQYEENSNRYDLFILLENRGDKSVELKTSLENILGDDINQCTFTSGKAFVAYTYNENAPAQSPQRLNNGVPLNGIWIDPKGSALLGISLNCPSVPDKVSASFIISYREERTTFEKQIVGEVVLTPQGYQNHIRNLN